MGIQAAGAGRSWFFTLRLRESLAKSKSSSPTSSATGPQAKHGSHDEHLVIMIIGLDSDVKGHMNSDMFYSIYILYQLYYIY